MREEDQNNILVCISAMLGMNVRGASKGAGGQGKDRQFLVKN